MNHEIRQKIASSGEIESFVAKNKGQWNHEKWLEFKESIKARFGDLNTDELGLMLESEKRIYHENSKGFSFELMVSEALFDLESAFPEQVKITKQPRFLGQGRPHRPDFELEYKLGGLTNHHLIECQNRNRSSLEIADKIYAVRGQSDRNRYIFVYNNPDFFQHSLRRRLDEMGVLHFHFVEFKEFITQLAADLALHTIGFATTQHPALREILHNSAFKLTFERASHYNPGRQNPPDKAMISGR